MTPVRLAQHWTILKQCEATGARPRVYRELPEEIDRFTRAIALA